MDRWGRELCLLALGVLALAWRITVRPLNEPPPLDRVLAWTLLLLPCYALFQIVPLPAVLLKFLSPARTELLDALRPVIPGISSAPLSIVPSWTASFLPLIGGYIVVFLIARDLVFQFSERPWTVVMPVIAVAALEAGYCLFQVFFDQDTGHRGTYASFDHFANLLGMSLPFAIMYPVTVLRGVDFRRKAPLRPVFQVSVFFGLTATILLGILYSASRTGFASSVVSLLVVAIAAWAFNAQGRARWAMAAVLASAAAYVLFSPDLISVWLASANEDIQGGDRWALWNESLRLLARFPVFGCGLGTYETAFMRYKLSAPMAVRTYVYNDYLQCLIELGAAGFSIMAVFFLSVLAKGVKTLSPNCEPETRYLALACIGSFGALLSGSCFNSNLYFPGNAMLAAWLAGLCCGLKFARPVWQKIAFRAPAVVETRVLSH